MERRKLSSSEYEALRAEWEKRLRISEDVPPEAVFLRDDNLPSDHEALYIEDSRTDFHGVVLYHFVNSYMTVMDLAILGYRSLGHLPGSSSKGEPVYEKVGITHATMRSWYRELRDRRLSKKRYS